MKLREKKKGKRQKSKLEWTKEEGRRRKKITSR
jgi:hypothetical protein